jgi:diguanylate cyclase (GGDEF)-like protein
MLNLIYTPGLWLFILAAVVIGGLILYSWRFRKTETGCAFILLMLCAFIWVAGFTLETAIADLQVKLFVSNIEFLGICFLPVAWVYLVRAYTGQKKPKQSLIFLSIIPLLTLIVIWTNPFHHWFMGNPYLKTSDTPFPVLFLDYQFWFYFIHAPSGYIFILYAIFILATALPKMNQLYQTQGKLMFVAILLPTITDVLYVLGFSPVRYYNFTTAVFSISGIILGFALFRHHFLDLLPLARDTVIDTLNDGVLVLDDQGRVVDVNPAAKKILKISDAIIGQSMYGAQDGFLYQVETLIQNNQSQKDMKIDEPSTQYYDTRITHVYNRRRTLIGQVVTLRDITERVQLFNQVQTLAITDSLTGIYNRRQFIELSRREIFRIQRSRKSSASAIMIDLDKFKEVNDTFGHPAGDQVLVAFVKTIQSQLRAFDIFGRLGGDEFAILLIDVTPNEAVAIGERLRASVAAIRIPKGNDEIRINASFGIVSTRQLKAPELEIEKMLDLADQALYQAKCIGRNRVAIFNRRNKPDRSSNSSYKSRLPSACENNKAISSGSVS